MSTRISSDMLIGSTLADIQRAHAALEQTSRQLSSGKSILAPSDNPSGTSSAIMLQSAIDGLGSYAASAKDGTAWLNAASGAMAGIGRVAQRARELVLEAGSGSMSQSDRESIAQTIEQLAEMAKQAANTQYAGQYIFSGSTTTTAPYQGGASDEYHGNSGSVSRAVGPGATVSVTVSLNTLLGEGEAAGDGKLLDTLRTIAKDMREGTPASLEALTNGDLGKLDANLNTLATLEAQAGAATNQVTSALNRVEDLQITTKEQLSNIEDVNYAQVAMEFSSHQAAFEAALRAGASIVQQSLLDFLH